MDPVPRTALNLALESLINKMLALDPISQPRLAPWQDKRLVLQLSPPDIAFTLVFQAGSVRVLADTNDQTDARIQGTPLAMLQFLTPTGDSSNSSTDAPAANITVQGDQTLVRAFQDLLRDLEPDWEGELAKYLGDVMAHEAGRRLRQGVKWGQKARTTLLADAEEFFTEEARLVPNRAEVSRKMHELPPLDQALDDLDRRIQALEQLLRDKPNNP